VQRDTKQRHTHTHHPLLHRQMCTAISAAPTTFSSLSVYPSIAQREREREKERERETEREREIESVCMLGPLRCVAHGTYFGTVLEQVRALSFLVRSSIQLWQPLTHPPPPPHTPVTLLSSLLSLSLSLRERQRETDGSVCVAEKRTAQT
jgi:hypothetical protein